MFITCNARRFLKPTSKKRPSQTLQFPVLEWSRVQNDCAEWNPLWVTDLLCTNERCREPHEPIVPEVDKITLLLLTAPVRTVIVRLLLLFNTRTAYKYNTTFPVGLEIQEILQYDRYADMMRSLTSLWSTLENSTPLTSTIWSPIYIPQINKHVSVSV